MKTKTEIIFELNNYTEKYNKTKKKEKYTKIDGYMKGLKCVLCIDSSEWHIREPITEYPIYILSEQEVRQEIEKALKVVNKLEDKSNKERVSYFIKALYWTVGEEYETV